MPVESYIAEPLELVVTRAHGVVTGKDMMDGMEAVLADRMFSSRYRGIFDLSETTGFEISLNQMRSMPYVWESGVHRAIVAPRALEYGMARMYQMMHDRDHGGALGVFRTLDEALEWIGVSRAEYDALLDQPAPGAAQLASGER